MFDFLSMLLSLELHPHLSSGFEAVASRPVSSILEGREDEASANMEVEDRVEQHKSSNQNASQDSSVIEFVQTSLQGLDDQQLKQLCRILRIFVPTEFDRQSTVERILAATHQDQDTALGSFISWIDSQKKTHRRNEPVVGSDDFWGTFIPTITPIRPEYSSLKKRKDAIAHEKEFDAEIDRALQRLREFEKEFKESERNLRKGQPSWEKIKLFLDRLTRLRTKEEHIRTLIIQKNNTLIDDNKTIKALEEHTRQQLDYFVAGFAKLRQRHDALIQRTAKIVALNESCHSELVGVASSEAHFAQLMANTVHVKMKEYHEMQDQLFEARDRIRELEEENEQRTQDARNERNLRLEAEKDTGCCRRQLRIFRKKFRRMQREAMDSLQIRHELGKLRRLVLDNRSELREQMMSAVKSKKMVVYNSRLNTLRASDNLEWKEKQDIPSANSPIRYVPKSIQPEDDTTSIIKSVALVGSKFSGRKTQAELLAEVYGYVPIDVEELMEKAAQERHEKKLAELKHEPQSEEIGDTMLNIIDAEEGLEVEEDQVVFDPAVLAERLRESDCIERGSVLHNWDFTKFDFDRLLACGHKVDIVAQLVVEEDDIRRRRDALLSTGWSPSLMIQSSPSKKKSMIEMPTDEAQLEEDQIRFEGMFGLGKLFCRVDGMDTRNGVLQRLEETIMKYKQDRCRPHLVWDEETLAYEEQHLMYIEDAQSWHYHITNPLIEKGKSKGKKKKGKSPTKKGAKGKGSKGKASGKGSPAKKSPTKASAKAPTKAKAGAASPKGKKKGSPKKKK